MPRPASASTCCPGEAPMPPRTGCASSPAPGWRAGTAPAPMPEAIRRALPDPVKVGDRWHIWHNLAEALRKEVAAHSACRATLPAKDGTRAVTTRERWAQVHALLDQGVGLLECARRLDLALNTVKRYACP